LILGHAATHSVLMFCGQHISTIKHTLYNHAQNFNTKFNNGSPSKKKPDSINITFLKEIPSAKNKYAAAMPVKITALWNKT